MAYRRRAELILRLYDRYGPTPSQWQMAQSAAVAAEQRIDMGATWWPARVRTVWAPLMPQDRAREAEVDALLVDRGILARRSAAERAGVDDTEAELGRWLVENEAIGASGGYPAHPAAATIKNPLQPS